MFESYQHAPVVTAPDVTQAVEIDRLTAADRRGIFNNISVSPLMPIRSVPRLLLFGLIALVLVPEGRAQSSAPLDLTLHVAVAEVQRAGALSLALVLRNGDAGQMLVLRGQPAFDEGGGLSLTVTDAGGGRRVVAMQSVNAHLSDPAAADEGMDARGRATQEQFAERIQVLPPGHGISVHRRIQATALFSAIAPGIALPPASMPSPTTGRYRLEVSYTPPTLPPAALAAGSVDAGAAGKGVR